MRREYLVLRKKLLEHRKNVIELREKKFKRFIINLAKIFGDRATIVLIGSRTNNTAKTYSDFDLIIIYRNLSEREVCDTVRKLKDLDLPIDFTPINVKNFSLDNKVFKEMLREKKILHDGIGLFS